MQTVKDCDYILVLENGNVVEFGTEDVNSVDINFSVNCFYLRIIRNLLEER